MVQREIWRRFLLEEEESAFQSLIVSRDRSVIFALGIHEPAGLPSRAVRLRRASRRGRRRPCRTPSAQAPTLASRFSFLKRGTIDFCAFFIRNPTSVRDREAAHGALPLSSLDRAHDVNRVRKQAPHEHPCQNLDQGDGHCIAQVVARLDQVRDDTITYPTLTQFANSTSTWDTYSFISQQADEGSRASVRSGGKEPSWHSIWGFTASRRTDDSAGTKRTCGPAHPHATAPSCLAEALPDSPQPFLLLNVQNVNSSFRYY